MNNHFTIDARSLLSEILIGPQGERIEFVRWERVERLVAENAALREAISKALNNVGWMNAASFDVLQKALNPPSSGPRCICNSGFGMNLSCEIHSPCLKNNQGTSE